MDAIGVYVGLWQAVASPYGTRTDAAVDVANVKSSVIISRV